MKPEYKMHPKMVRKLADFRKRHLWPAFHTLIAVRKPATVFREQVASPDGREWLAGIRADMEGMGYAFGAADLCAAGVGAPHRRQRLYWLANANLPGEPTPRWREWMSHITDAITVGILTWHGWLWCALAFTMGWIGCCILFGVKRHAARLNDGSQRRDTAATDARKTEPA